MDIVHSPELMGERTQNLPSGFERVEQISQKFKPTLQNMPWLETWLRGEPNAKLEVNLARVTLAGTHEQFLFGSFIRGTELTKAAAQLDSHRKQIVDALFYTHIGDIVRQGFSPYAKFIDHGIADQPIFYFGNKGGQRVYFMRFQLGAEPAIIRVAVCDKANQEEVLVKITNRSRKQIKFQGRL